MTSSSNNPRPSAERAVTRTPLLEYAGDKLEWSRIYLKDETKQTTGSFKFRSVFHKLNSLPASDALFVAASTGNHGLAVAASADFKGVSSRIYVPERTPRAKIKALSSFNANVIEVTGDYLDCVTTAKRWAKENGAHYVESFEDPDIIDGHRSLCREIDEALPEFDVCFVPVGGGGLLASALGHWVDPPRTVIGVEAACAPAMTKSLAAGTLVRVSAGRSIAEGIALPSVGWLPFCICKRAVPQITRVNEEQISRAMKLLWNHHSIQAEGAGAASLAGALQVAGRGRCCICLISGGNIDPEEFQRIISSEQT
jgi:threonine dehydratase